MKKYYIYHIPNKKIGCTMYPKHRIKKAQKYENYEILEIHTDIKIAADREIELQKQYGYTVDKRRYDCIDFNACRKGGLKANKNKKEYFGGKYGGGNRKNMLEVAKIGRKVVQERHGIKIEAFDFETNKFIGIYPSITQAAKQLNCSEYGVHMVINGIRKKHKNFFFKKIQQN